MNTQGRNNGLFVYLHSSPSVIFFRPKTVPRYKNNTDMQHVFILYALATVFGMSVFPSIHFIFGWRGFFPLLHIRVLLAFLVLLVLMLFYARHATFVSFQPQEGLVYACASLGWVLIGTFLGYGIVGMIQKDTAHTSNNSIEH